MVNSKFKHLKNYQKFDTNDKINEGWETVASIALTLLQVAPSMAGPVAKPESTFVFQETDAKKSDEMKQADVPKKVKIAVGTTSTDPVWYNQGRADYNSEVQEHVPLVDGKEATGKRYLKGSIKLLLDNIRNRRPAFEGFEYITKEEAIKEGLSKPSSKDNFLKIGNKTIEGTGQMIFNWTEDAPIVASGNGLYSLVRIYAANLESSGKLDLAQHNVANLGVEVEEGETFTNVESYTMLTTTNKSEMVKTLNYMFEITTEMGNKNPDKNWHIEKGSAIQVNLDEKYLQKLIGKSDDVVAETIKDYVLYMNNDFMPRGNDRRMLLGDKLPSFLKELELKQMTVEEVKPFLQSYQQEKTQEGRDKIFLEFIEKNMELWKDNYNKVMDSFEDKYDIDDLPNISDSSVKSIVSSLEGKHFRRTQGRRNFINSEIGETSHGGKLKDPLSTTKERTTKTKVGELPKVINQEWGAKKESMKYIKRFKNF